MEDLKKQTAKRLSQEQNKQNRQIQSPSHGNKKGNSQLKGLTGENLPILRVNHHRGLGMYDSASATQSVPQGTQGPFRKHQPQMSHNTSAHFHQGHVRQHHPKIKVHENYYRPQQSQAVNSHRQLYGGPPHKPTVGHVNTLPHGLTVTELKEMTRARLASESAMEKNAVHQPPVHNQQQHYPARSVPDEYEHGMNATRPRFRSHDTLHSPRHRVNSSDSFSSAPPGDTHRFSSATPHNIIRKAYSHEAHDNISVASFNSIGSEYIASDVSGVHTIHSSVNEDASRYSLNQSNSFTSEARATEGLGAGSSNSVKGLFDSSSRRRASTASPPALSNLLEDKPLASCFLNENEPVSHGLGGIFPHVRQNSAPSSRGGSPLLHLQSNNTDIWGDIFGRPESISLVPTLTHSGESSGSEFHDFASIQRESSLGGIVPNAVAESVLDPAPLNHQGSFDAQKSPIHESKVFQNVGSWDDTENNLTDKVGGDHLVMSQLGNDLSSILQLNSHDGSKFSSFRSLSQSIDHETMDRQNGSSSISPSIGTNAEGRGGPSVQEINPDNDVNVSHEMSLHQGGFGDRGLLK